MHVHNVRQPLAGENPLGSHRRVKCELVRVVGVRAMVMVSDVNEPGTVFRKEAMLEDNVPHAITVARNFPDADGVRITAKFDIDRCQNAGVGQPVQSAVRWRRDGNVPILGRQSDRQVADDVANPADLATGQGAVFGRQKYDGAGIDKCQPSG